MSTEQIQAEDKKTSSVEMAAIEKHNSVEVGEVSDVSEQDIGMYARHGPDRISTI